MHLRKFHEFNAFLRSAYASQREFAVNTCLCYTCWEIYLKQKQNAFYKCMHVVTNFWDLLCERKLNKLIWIHGFIYCCVNCLY